MRPRSAGAYSHSTARPSTSQPLRLAYISIVIAVHDASEAASSSCGLGPSSLPPWSFGSSAVSVCERTLTSWRKFSSCWAVARIGTTLGKRVEQQAGQDLGEEVRRLRRHHLACRGNLAHEPDRGGPHEEARLHAAGADTLARLCRRA